MVLQWVPAHCGIRGNVKADTLAKEGAQKEQIDRLVSFHEIKTIIKTNQRRAWQLQHRRHNPNDSYHLLRRGEQVKIFRLRIGHNCLQHHLFTKFGIRQSNECPCVEGPVTSDHILQSCPTYAAMRTKLYGILEDLRRTANFIRETGLDI